MDEEVEDVFTNEEETTYIDESDISQLCRVCANPNEYLIPIFHGEGIENDLQNKIRKHLPIEVKETDKLPVQLCYQCASTLIAWHDMVIGCLEADEKLRSLLPEDQKECLEVTENNDVSTKDSNPDVLPQEEISSFEVRRKAKPSKSLSFNVVEEMRNPAFDSEKVVEEEIIPYESEVLEEVEAEQSGSSKSKNYIRSVWRAKYFRRGGLTCWSNYCGQEGPSSHGKGENRLDGQLHCMLRGNSRRDCCVCSNRVRERKRTKYYCDTCKKKPALHPGQCFERYHFLKKYKSS